MKSGSAYSSFIKGAFSETVPSATVCRRSSNMNHATPCFHCPLMELLENQIIMTRSQRLINKYSQLLASSTSVL